MIRPVDMIGFGLGPANPDTFLTALGARDDWQDLQVGGALCLNFYEVFTKPASRTAVASSDRLNASCTPWVTRSSSSRVDSARWRRSWPSSHPRVMVVQAAPPDEYGNVNLSLHMGATRPELIRAGEDPDRLLIVEVNPKLPRTKSLPPEYENTISLDLVDVLVETNLHRSLSPSLRRTRWTRRSPATRSPT